MMTKEFLTKLKKWIIKDEGFVLFPYPDTENNITIGVGYNLTARGLPHAFLDKQCEDDIAFIYDRLYEDFTWFRTLDDTRKMVLINLGYNVGYKGLGEFKKLLMAMSDGNHAIAADEILNSKAATKAPGRYKVLASVMRSGADAF